MEKTGHKEAEDILINAVKPVGSERIKIEDLFMRIPAEDITAGENVPHFDRSPYDGYAFKAEDTRGATETKGKKLKVIENIRAGQSPEKKVENNTAIRLMTGAPIPEGADCVCKYEDTDFTDESVTIKREYRAGENIIRAGEDIREGSLPVKAGTVADAAVTGIAASLGLTELAVYKKPKAAIISTGDEVVDITETPAPGKIRDSNRFTIAAALKHIGIEPSFAGHVSDYVNDIKEKILKVEEESHVIISTGGVSAGDFDLVPKAMEEAGYEILVRGIDMKPGMACAYGIKENRLFLALSGNPASGLTNLQCICYPALRKLGGLRDFRHRLFRMILKDDIKKAERGVRFIRGSFDIEEGRAVFTPKKQQGNIVISSAALCNAYACVPEGIGPLSAEDTVEGFLI